MGITITVRRLSNDYWERECYLDVNTNSFYVMVDGKLHTTTDEGEPLYALRDDAKIVVEG